jgi:hypothetical protein
MQLTCSVAFNARARDFCWYVTNTFLRFFDFGKNIGSRLQIPRNLTCNLNMPNTLNLQTAVTRGTEATTLKMGFKLQPHQEWYFIFSLPKTNGVVVK